MLVPARHSTALLAAALLAAVLGAVAQAGPKSDEAPRARHQRGLASVDSLAALGLWSEVAGRAEAVLSDDGVDEDLRWRLHQRAGLALHRLGRLESALAHLEAAVLWGPTVALNHRNLASLLVALDRHGRAMAEYASACDLDPRDCSVWLEYAHILVDLGQRPKAAEALQMAADNCDPADPRLLRARSRYHLAGGDPAAALTDLARLHDLDPTAESRQQLALARLRAGQPEATLLLLAPHWHGGLDDQGRRILLEADAALGDNGRAVALALSLGNGSPPASRDARFWAQAALVCIDTGRDHEGLILIDQAISLAPDDPGLRRNRVLLLRRLGRHDDADEEGARIEALTPGRTAAPAEHGSAHRSPGRPSPG